MFNENTVAGIITAANEDKAKNIHSDKSAAAFIADHLNAFVKNAMPEGPRHCVMNVRQAEIIRDLLAPAWAMAMVKIGAFEELSMLRLYADVFGTEKAYSGIQEARDLVSMIDYVFYSIMPQKPEFDTKHFIDFIQDRDTKLLTKVYHPIKAQMYQMQLIRAWQSIPVFDRGAAQ